jgi:hypothetical protein
MVLVIVVPCCSSGNDRRHSWTQPSRSCSPKPGAADGEQGRGLQIVEALSARWGWRYEDGGKAVFAVLAREV